MGSFQQIFLGVVCVVAAFAFGYYVNNHPPGDQHPLAQNPSEDLANQPTGNVQSRLTNSQFDVVNRRPAPIATMRNPLKPRFSMPLDAQASVVPRAESKLPPPSQLSNQDLPKLELDESRPGLATTKHEPSNSAKTTDVPDFSSIASEFRNNPIELPTLGSMPSHSQTIAAPMVPPDTFAPVKDPAHRIGPNTLDPATMRHPSTVDVREVRIGAGTGHGFSTEDFSPRLKDPFVGPPTTSEVASNSNLDVVPVDQLARIPGYGNPATVDIGSFKPPMPPAYSNHVVSKQAAPNDVYRGSLTVEPGNEPVDSGTSNRVRTMLPFGLSDEAKSRLVSIRSDANSRISLNTTQFVEHVVKSGETLQSISIRYFGNPDYYLDIYLANRNKLRNPVDIREGIFLKIPVYQ